MATIKRAMRRVPFVPRLYARLQVWRGLGAGWRDWFQARKLFKNPAVYMRALHRKAGSPVVLQTHDGLNITIRQNLWDARIIREMYFDKPYLRYTEVHLPTRPTVVDIGGYIGDFSLYMVHYHDARVVVYEPVVEHFDLLSRNVKANGYSNRITVVQKAVSNSGELVLNVQAKDVGEFHVSAYWYEGEPQRTVLAVTLTELLGEHGLETVDLLKVDTEGGEYDILTDIPPDTLQRIRNVVFEWHFLDGYEARLQHVMDGLEGAGFALRRDGQIVSAYRA